MINNSVFLAKAAKVFGVPTLYTTAFAERQNLFQELQAVHPEQVPIDRTGLNSWDDPRVLDWVRKTGKKKLVMAGLWTEVCLSMPALSALAELRSKATGKKQLIIAGTITSVCLAFPCIAAVHDGYQVFAVVDASGTYSKMAQEITLARLVQAGVVPMDTESYTKAQEVVTRHEVLDSQRK